MNTYFIINKQTLGIEHAYDAEELISFGGPWGNPEQYVQLQCPEGENRDTVRIENQEGTIVVVVDETKKANWKRQQNLIVKNNYTKQRMDQAESDIQALLQGMDDTTHLMLALSYMDIALNITGDRTSQEINDAKAQLSSYRNLMASVQQIRATRDADIAAFTPPYTDVTPLYPEE